LEKSNNINFQAGIHNKIFILQGYIQRDLYKQCTRRKQCKMHYWSKHTIYSAEADAKYKYAQARKYQSLFGEICTLAAPAGLHMQPIVKDSGSARILE
jgi:hypothetical protein